MKNKLLKKFISFSYGSWVGLILGILTTIYTTRILNPEDFGKYSMFLLSINIMVIIAMLGTDQAFIRFYYEEKEENRKALLYKSIKIPFILSMLISILLIIFSDQVTFFILEEESFLLVILLAGSVVIKIIQRFGLLIIRMKQKGNLFSFLEILDKFSYLILLIIFYIYVGSTYKIFLYASLVTFALVTIVAILSEKKDWRIDKDSFSKPSHDLLEMLRYGFPLAITVLITWVFQSVDKLSLKYWSDFEELGLYSAAFKIIALLSVLQASFSNFWTPVSYEHFEKNSTDKVFYEKMTQVVSLVMFAVAIFTIVAKDLITLLLGESYSSAANLMPFLVFIPLMYTISETTVIGINFLKKPKWHVFIAIISCLINVLGNWVLVPKFGALGASISTGISFIAFFALRTAVSLHYYPVNYGLKKIYTMVIVVFVQALISISTTSLLTNTLVGFISLIILVILYLKELLTISKHYTIFVKVTNKLN